MNATETTKSGEVVVVNTTDPAYVAFMNRLSRRLQAFAGRKFDERLFKDAKGAIDRLRANAISHGMALPPLVPVLVRKQQVIEVFRGDATAQAIGATAYYLIERYGASHEDVSWAFGLAYPEHTRGKLH